MSLRQIFTPAVVHGATFIGLNTVTEVPLPKSSPHHGRVTKIMTGANVQCFGNKRSNGYENMVKRRLGKEGKDPEDFQLSPRKWGQRVPGLPIVEHQGNEYLEVIFLKNGDIEYRLDGTTPIKKEDIIGLKSPVAAEQGGLEDKVHLRTFAVESIRSINIDGQTFTV